MTFSDYLLLFRRGWLVVLMFAVLGTVVGGLFAARTVPTYASQASLVVKVATDGNLGSLASAGDYAVRGARTYAALANTDLVLEPAALVTGDSRRVLGASVGAVVREGTAVIDVNAAGDEPGVAARRAQAVADVLSLQGGVLDASATGGPVELFVISRAEEPTTSSSPAPLNFVLIGLVVGLVLGIAAVVVAHSFDDRLLSAADLPRGTLFAFVSALPLQRRGEQSNAAGPRLEAFRRLRAILEVATAERGIITVAPVTSGGDAAPIVSDLAMVLRETGSTVAVVDLDFRRPLTDAGATATGPGLTDVLLHNASVGDVIQPSADDTGLSRITRGEGDDRTAQLLGGAAWRNALSDLEAQHTFVLLIAPPVLERAESVVVAGMSAASLLVAESRSTRRWEVVQALGLLSGQAVKDVGLVLDRVRPRDLGRLPSFAVSSVVGRGAEEQ